MNPFHVFELDETGGEATLQRLELLCLELLRTGSVSFPVPNPQQQFFIDGAVRMGRTHRELKVDSAVLARAMVVAKFSSALLRGGKTCTTREVYYRNKRKLGGGWEEDRFSNESQANRTIALTCQLLAATRMSLGIVACSKGLCAGLVGANKAQILPVPPTSTYQELQAFDAWCRDAAESRTRPTFVLVVEKHTVLFKLVQGAFMSRFPCVAVTGKGFPDLDTRRFVRLLWERLGLPVYGLCDMNPHGLSIMSTFAHGSIGFSGEGFRYATPSLVTIGLTSRDGEEYAEYCRAASVPTEFADFNAQDDLCLKGLMENNLAFATCERLFGELEAMRASRRKLDLDSLECIEEGFLFDHWLPNKLARLQV